MPTSGNYVVDALVYESESSRMAWTMQNGQPAALTFSFMTSPPSGESLYTGYGDPNATFQALSASQQAAVRLALQAWSDVSGLSFVELTNGQRGTLEFGMHAFTVNAAGYATPPTLLYSTGQLPAGSPSGNVWFSSGLPSDLGPGSGWFKLLLHEIGHALGLKHPGNYSGSETGPFLPAEEDNSDYTVMSYNGTTPPTAVPLFDIIAIQYRYGPDANVRSGNDTYVFGNDKLIWDGGGVDTVSAAGQTQSVTIDLAGGTWNYIGASRGTYLSHPNQVFIGYHTQIENATGGSGADTLRGNAAANVLFGNAGNDTLWGGLGGDVAAYAVHSSAASWVRTADGAWSVTAGADGVDTVREVELLRFTDRDVSLQTFVNDFNGDARTDLLWRHASSGQVWEYQLNGTTTTFSGGVATVGLDWRIEGTGDFNGDGRGDILWRNTSTGQVWEYQLNGTATIFSGSVATVGLAWRIEALADFNGDGRSDILWRNTSTGQVWEYQLNGTTTTFSGSVATVGLDWIIAGTGDFNGDEYADILWRNTNTGQVWQYQMNGTATTFSGSVATVGLEWSHPSS